MPIINAEINKCIGCDVNGKWKLYIIMPEIICKKIKKFTMYINLDFNPFFIALKYITLFIIIIDQEKLLWKLNVLVISSIHFSFSI